MSGYAATAALAIARIFCSCCLFSFWLRLWSLRVQGFTTCTGVYHSGLNAGPASIVLGLSSAGSGCCPCCFPSCLRLKIGFCGSAGVGATARFLLLFLPSADGPIASGTAASLGATTSAACCAAETDFIDADITATAAAAAAAAATRIAACCTAATTVIAQSAAAATAMPTAVATAMPAAATFASMFIDTGVHWWRWRPLLPGGLALLPGRHPGVWDPASEGITRGAGQGSRVGGGGYYSGGVSRSASVKA
mmetsp:Transcript_12763/g.38485  ORF Transcript_12763/g.38485 Transcript_12763/m.38485 type:complete len:251 (-) Transcript_12763:5631-6383(-)